jgi:Tfp pilus assembly protein PilF
MENTERRKQLEAMLQDDPHDAFLRYGLALELAGAGDTPNALVQLEMLLAHTPEYVPAYLQAGKLSMELGRDEAARHFFSKGVLQAQQQGNAHAAEEMAGVMASLG